MCGETEIPAHVLMTTVNQLKEPATADENTPTGFQRQFKVSDSIHCLYYGVSVLCPITCANVFQILLQLLLESHNYVTVSACSDFE